MAEPSAPVDTNVTFVDEAGTTYNVRIPRAGHTNREVRTVAYRSLCREIAEGKTAPHGELIFVSIRRLG